MNTHDTLCAVLRKLDVRQIDAGAITTTEVFEACRAVVPQATDREIADALLTTAVENLHSWSVDDPEDESQLSATTL